MTIVIKNLGQCERMLKDGNFCDNPAMVEVTWEENHVVMDRQLRCADCLIELQREEHEEASDDNL